MEPAIQRKPSRTTSRRDQLRALASRGKPGLALDTSFSRHQGQTPQQVWPYESRTQELSFVSISDAKAKQKPKTSLRKQLENRLPIRPSNYRSISDSPAALNERTTSRQNIQRVHTSSTTPDSLPVPLHKRIKGLRPSPLDLTQDVSPSDRAITIGLAVPSDVLSDHTVTPQSAQDTRKPAARTQEVQTPTIVITPAKEDFDVSQSPEDFRQPAQRQASSVYSRYTNCLPKYPQHGDTPPVPLLPQFVGGPSERQYTRTVFEEGFRDPARHRDNALSVCTTFEEDDAAHLQPSAAKRLTSQSHLPTPRRSRGWWNVVTSPFSAGSKYSVNFWRSPQSADDDEDRQRMLDDAAGMGTVDTHAGVIFTNRTPNDDELRSAIPPSTGTKRPSVPKRSGTAPGAIDAGDAPVNIYRIPSQGLAAAYYDGSRHFPSLILEGNNAEASRGSLDGWSPSQSVAHPEDDYQGDGTAKGVAAAAAEGELSEKAALESEDDACSEATDFSDEEGPFADSPKADVVATNPPPQQRKVFSTPSEEELKEASPPRPVAERNNTAATQLSYFSPLSAKPTVEDTHVATFMGPQSTNPEQLREVELTPSHSTPASSRGLATSATMVREIGDEPTGRSVGNTMSEKRRQRPALHIRTDSESSRGLGITDGEKELYPSPKAFLHRQPRLGTDRFGQLTIRSVEDDKPARPWHRRFFWLLASAGALLLVLLVVLLVILIPQHHGDMAVQAEWLNLTGFPALPTGIATMVRPNTAKQVSGCVSPQSLWSCDAPPSDHQTGAQPNFRFEIRFRNGTVPKNDTQLAKRSGHIAHAGAVVRRSSWSRLLYAATPTVPSKDDQEFLGQYTDNVTEPYEGEKTPFYMTLLDPSAVRDNVSAMEKRQSDPYPYPNLNSSNSTSNASSVAAERIPPPALASNGKPAHSQLYPYAEAQPLRLFNRGQDDEHFGFYTYFDRSLLVSNVSSSSGAGTLNEGMASNVALANASAVCTWSQTRLHVQIWTRKPQVSSLEFAIPLKGLPAANSTANDTVAPGSFPYAVTVTLDRHGGQAEKKGVYCYGLDREKRVVEDVKMWVSEDRGFDGELVNAADVPGSNQTMTKRSADEAYGGIDGGNGGCACAWQNWR